MKWRNMQDMAVKFFNMLWLWVMVFFMILEMLGRSPISLKRPELGTSCTDQVRGTLSYLHFLST
jgi:hypothetical protein